MADVAPEPVELGTSDLVVPHEQVFHRLGVFSSFIEPLEDGIFIEAFHARQATDATAFDDQRQGLDDLCFIGSLAMEDGAVVLVEGSQTAFAVKSLATLASLTKP